MSKPLPSSLVRFPDGVYRFYRVTNTRYPDGSLIMRAKGRTVGNRVHTLMAESYADGIWKVPIYNATIFRPHAARPASALTVAGWILTHNFKASKRPTNPLFRAVPGFARAMNWRTNYTITWSGRVLATNTFRLCLFHFESHRIALALWLAWRVHRVTGRRRRKPPASRRR